MTIESHASASTDPFIIRKMESHDLERVVTMESASSLTPWSQAMFLEEMLSPFGSCFVVAPAEPGADRAVGFICFRNLGDESELFNLCVHPLFRRRGLGKRLMHFYHDFCVQRGVKHFHLEVRSANKPALRLYRGFSYHVTGTRPRFYRGVCDAFRMMKRI